MSAPAASRPASPSSWLMYRAMVGVGLVCGALIVSVYELTKPIIAHNQAEALQAAVFDVLADAKSSKTFRYQEGQGFSAVAGEAGDGPFVYAGYDSGGRLVGVAVEAQGMGYQDIIRLLYGYSPERNAIVGMHVLESKETPGLGDKIISDADFAGNFESLDVALAADGDNLANAIVAVKHGQKHNAWEIDGITGATISSTAVADLLSASAAKWTPVIQRRLNDFQEDR